MGGLTCALGALALSWAEASHAVVELEAGAVWEVDPTPSFVTSFGYASDVASDGSGWLVIYDAPHTRGYNLVGVRVSPDGELPDRPGFEIATSEYLIGGSAVAFDGLDYVVVWSECEDAEQCYVKTRRFGTDGTSYGESVTLATIDSNYVPHVGVARGTDASLAVWCFAPALSGTTTCEVATLQGSTVVATDSVALDSLIFGVNLAFSGQSWLLSTFTHDHDVLSVRIGADGLALDDAPLPIAVTDAPEQRPVAAASEDGWVMVFTGAGGVRSARVSFAGNVVVNDDPVASEPSGFSDLQLETLADGYVVVAERHGDSIEAQFLDSELNPEGDVVDVELNAAYSLSRPRPSWNGSSLLVTWSGPGEGVDPAVRGVRLDRQGEFLDPEDRAISTRPNAHRNQLAAYGANGWLTAWTDDRSGSPAVYAQRLNDAGEPLSITPLEIENAGFEEEVVAVAGSPFGWLVVWIDRHLRVRARRVAADGARLDDAPLELGVCYSHGARAIFNGSNWIVTWREVDGFAVEGTASIARIDPGGEWVDGSPLAVSGVNAALGPVGIALDELGYAVSWQPASGGLVVQHVNLSGALVESAPTTLVAPNVSVTSHFLDYQTGDGWLLWWQNNTPYFRSLGSDLPTQTLGSANVGLGPYLARMGGRALVVWPHGDRHHVGVAEVHGPLESRLELALDPYDNWHPHLAPKDESTALLTYASYETFGGTLAPRLKSQVVHLFEDASGGSGGSPDQGSGGSPDAGDGGFSGIGSGGMPEGGSPEAGSGGAQEPTSGAGTPGNGGSPDSGGDGPSDGGGGVQSDGGEPSAGAFAGRRSANGGEPSSAGEAGAAAAPSDGTVEGGGCTCRATSRDAEPSGLLLALALVGALYRRRRIAGQSLY